ncbi:MAG: tyrosine-type recombinase/integrase [Pseudomonadota bacterium]
MKRRPKTSANPNRPAPGSSIKVEPIRDLKAIKRIKALLRDKPRDLCLFTLGINTAYRANELLSLTVDQVAHLKAGDRLDLKQSKNGRYRATVLNGMVVEAIQNWTAVHPDERSHAPLFLSQRVRAALGVSSLNHLVKDWCRDAGLRGNYGSHSLRKTWGYHQLRLNNAPIPLLMEAYGHATQAQTLDYLCIESKEIAELYAMEL